MTVSYPHSADACHSDALPDLEIIVRRLFGEQARQLARETLFVQRRSPIDGAAFAQVLVFAFLDEPDATYTDLQQMLACQNIVVSPQAIEQRMTEKASRFLHRLVEQLLSVTVLGGSCEVGLLTGFTGVYLQDGTIIQLPDDLQEVWRGCGGYAGTGAEAGVRLQVRLELQRGQLEGPWLQDALFQ